MISLLPKSLIETATQVLLDSRLFEQAYKRKRAMDLIPSTAIRLAHKMVMLHHMPSDCPHAPHWETSCNGHITELNRLTKLDGKKRLAAEDIHQTMFHEPIGTYEEYEDIHASVQKLKKDIKFSPATPEDYEAIKNKYAVLLKSLVANKVKFFDELG